MFVSLLAQAWFRRCICGSEYGLSSPQYTSFPNIS